MSDILSNFNQPENYLYVLFILLSLGYWLITVFGFLSISALDGLFHLDLSHDIDMDHDSAGLLESTLSFIGVGKVPVTLIVTVFMLIQGVLGIIMNGFILSLVTNMYLSWILVIVGFVATFAVALFASAWFMKLFYPLFRDYGQADKSQSLVGKMAKVSTGTLSSQFGQAYVKLENGETAEISVRLNDPERTLKYGDQILITDYSETRNIYTAEAYSVLENE
ncbi:MAG: hypothetical protein RIS47_805 [Bacteroidota bacterium]|jgi:hypothetical protein